MLGTTARTAPKPLLPQSRGTGRQMRASAAAATLAAMSSLALLMLLTQPDPSDPALTRKHQFQLPDGIERAVEPVRARGDENRFTHGPILGRLSSDSVGVWARMLKPGAFTVRYGTDPDVLDQTAEPVTVGYLHDLTGHVSLTGLAPDTRYHYELQNPNSTGRSGRRGSFKTLPSGDQYRDADWNPDGLFNFTFEVGCCNNQNPWHGNGPGLPGIRTMIDHLTEAGRGDARQPVDFGIMNGDWLYEVRRDFLPANWLAANQVTGLDDETIALLETTPAITGVWENYKFFLDQAPPLTTWHANVPSYFTFDDHEILNDIWGAGEAGLVDRRALFRDVGVRAWYDYLGWANEIPFSQAAHFGLGQMEARSDVLTDPAADFTALDLDQLNNLHVHWGTPTAGVNENELDVEPPANPNAAVYDIVEVVSPTQVRVRPAAKRDATGAYSIGRRSYWKKTVANCDIFFLDCRGMRGLHKVDDPAMEGLSLLGPAQRDWLERESRASTADFLFVVSTVPFTIPHVGGEAIRDGAIGGGKDEAWTVFLDEREALIDLWDGLPQPVVVLTGDLHNSFAVEITDNVYEMACGPLGSNNHTAADEAFRPPNGKFQYGPRPIDILWSTWFPPDVARANLKHLTYTTVQINNVFDAPKTYAQNDAADGVRKIAFPRPQMVISFYDGHTGRLRFAHSIRAAAE